MELERSWYAIQTADILASRVDQAGLSSSSANLPENAKKDLYCVSKEYIIAKTYELWSINSQNKHILAILKHNTLLIQIDNSKEVFIWIYILYDTT